MTDVKVLYDHIPILTPCKRYTLSFMLARWYQYY